MFGFIALGFFAAFAFGMVGGSGKDGKGGFLSTLIDNFKKLNDEEESDEKDVKELRALLKKKTEDLSEREKKRIKELSKKVDSSYLNDSELEKLDKITGASSEDEEDEDDGKDTGKKEDDEGAGEEDTELDFNKTLAILQSEIESKEDDNSNDANDLRQAYDAMIKCAFDGNGDKRKPEDIESEFNKLDESIRKKIEKHVKKSSSDEKALEEYKDKKSKVTPEQAAAALEKAKAKRAEIAKKEEVDALEDARKKELEGKTDEDKKSINEKYDKDIKAAEIKWDAKIKEHMDAAAKADKSESLRQMEKSAKQAEAKKKELENKKAELDKPEAIEKEIKACGDVNWDEGEYTEGSLSSSNEADKKGAEEFLKSRGVNVDMYNKYRDIKSTLKEGEKIEENEDLKKAAEEVIKKKKEEIDKQIKEQDKIINDYNSAKDEVNNANKPKETGGNGGTGEPAGNGGTGEPEEDVTADDFEDGFSIEDKDGTKYFKRDGKFYMKTKNGEEVEEEDFDAWLKEVENNTEFDTSDLEDEATTEEEKKKQDPRKVWKQKTYKRGNKTFKTKSYYNKKGNSISADEFREKVANFEKSKKQKNESFNISNFLKDKLIVERFYPRDITNYLQEHLR